MRLLRLALAGWIGLALLAGCGAGPDQLISQLRADLAAEQIRPDSIALGGPEQDAILQIALPAPADQGADLLAIAGYAAEAMRTYPWLARLEISETAPGGGRTIIAGISRSALLDWESGKLSDAEFRQRWRR